MDKPLINRVAQSSIHTFNLENYYPKQEFISFDLKDYLFQGLILREKDFRNALKEYNWEKVNGKIVLVYCSSDAIIPVWAYMLVASHAKNAAEKVFIGNRDEFLKHHYYSVLNEIDYSTFDEARVVIKGCSDKPVPPSAYAFLTEKLQSFAQSVMYGEPCSTVPIFKRPRILSVKK